MWATGRLLFAAFKFLKDIVSSTLPLPSVIFMNAEGHYTVSETSPH